MAMYICSECDQLTDGDHYPCVDHPGGSNKLACEEYATELEEEMDMKKEFKRMKAEYDREIISGLRRKM